MHCCMGKNSWKSRTLSFLRLLSDVEALESLWMLKVAGRKGTRDDSNATFENLLWKKACCTLLSLEVCYVHSKQHISIVRRHFRESIRNTPHKRLNGPIDITLCVLMSLAPGIKHARVYQTPRERVKVLLIYLPRTQSATSKQVSKMDKVWQNAGKEWWLCSD